MDEDMKQIRFTIPGQPFGKQRPKFSRAGAYVKTYTPKETTSYENLVKLFYNEAAKGKMFPEGAMLDVRIIAYYEIPKSTSKKKRREMLEPYLKKADYQNGRCKATSFQHPQERILHLPLSVIRGVQRVAVLLQHRGEAGQGRNLKGRLTTALSIP